PIYAFDRAACIVSLDSNFLQDEPGSIRYARQFIDGRRVRVPNGELLRAIDSDIRTKGESATAPAGAFRANRLFVAESTPTVTGAMADHRVPLTPSQVDLVARALAVAVGVKAQGLEAPPLPQPLADWVNIAARDLLETSKQHKGATLVVAGPNQPPTVHALAHVMNGQLCAIGVTCAFTQPLENWPNPKEPLDPAASLRDLVEDMRRPDGDPQGVDTLIILGGNPAYDAPVDLDFARQLQAFSSRPGGGGGVPGAGGLRNVTAHLSLYYDETSFYCQWHVPESHYLESWGDVRAYNGAVSVLQPLIAPLYNSRTAIEMLAAMLGQGDVSPLETVRNFWRGQNLVPAEQFDLAWDRWLQKGIIDGTAFPALREKPVANLNLAPAAPAAAGGYEVSFRPDPCVWDGRYANNGWLQELPKPLTKVTWDNAVYMSRNTAVALGVLTTKHDEAPTVTLSYSGRTLPDKEFPEELPVWVVPGHPDGSITIHLGYGRKRAGRVGGIDGQTRGFNAYALLTSDAPNFGGGVQINATGRTMQLACTQDHQLIEERRQLVRSHTIAQVERDFVRRGGASGHAEEGAEQTGHSETGHGEGHHASIYPEYDYKHQRAWGMVIDMNACIGCNACVVACQAENNSPVVGKDQVLKGREMHWLRIDTYYRAAPGTADPVTNPETVFQPMLCQHCENAPCEVVCPVAATTHSHEGINEMTYNRCVGTRYCSNNCPYKVRRFNFLQYQDKTTPVLKLMRNPDVTVRDRGVMEKCTYCVQRVNQTRIELEKLIAIDADDATPPEQREQNARTRHELMRKLQTACQQSCPTEAIVFGDLHYVEPDGRKSRVARLRDDPLNYGLLTELNTQPRTTYLPRLRNPHPEVGPAEISPTGDRPPGSEAKA
ncbi:MAG TPA: 4Fe-4S dicluster domain-containing protein, partial [Tepidisphaeraceae bacterium]|nr:4Fe-4S dicluster domain-containing protein [Tepidisphaeraceae bacterium]